MKAIVVKNPGRNSSLHWQKVPDPLLKHGDVLIENHATAVNRADLLQRRGLYAPPADTTDILGLECAGVIVKVGQGVTDWKVGDRVAALLTGGGYAQYVAVNQQLLLPIPDALTFQQAAAIPETFITAYQLLFDLGQLDKSQRVLIHAGASGVGVAAIQLASEKGALIAITAGTDEKVAFCKKLGAHLGINYRRTPDFSNKTLTWSNKQGVHLVLDCIGASYLERNLMSTRTDGRIILYGLLGGHKATLSLATLLSKRITIISSTLRSRPLPVKARLVSEFRLHFWPLFLTGALMPVIHDSLMITDVEKAHHILLQNQNIGKVVLQIPHH